MAIDTVRSRVVSTRGLDLDATLLHRGAAGESASLPESTPPATAHDHALTLLIGRMADGDESALGLLYDDTRAVVHGLATRILRDAFAAEEITVEVYTHAYRLLVLAARGAITQEAGA
jgi:hypothetical protein